jgi:AraC family transcriptional regulator
MFPQSKLPDPLIYQIGLALKNELNTNGSIDRLYTESMVNTLLIHLIKRHSCHPYSSPQLANGLTHLRLQQVLEYIHEHLTQNISLAELAAIAQMSSHLNSPSTILTLPPLGEVSLSLTLT